MADDLDPKYVKKMAKARAKAAKKRPLTKEIDPAGPDRSDGKTPAERSAAAAERQVALQRWRVAFALVSALVALATLALLFFKSRG